MDYSPLWVQSVLVHEVAHSVMDIGMSPQQREAVSLAYNKAKEEKLYDLESYTMANDQEYWAMLAQAWFDATRHPGALLFLPRHNASCTFPLGLDVWVIAVFVVNDYVAAAVSLCVRASAFVASAFVW